ncbi:MAG: zinc ribbon domain-containing protein [Ilumatobacteraceae bacterium]
MIVCRKCSRRSADGVEFCACGAYLPFDGEPVVDEPAPARPTAGAMPPPPGPSVVPPPPAVSGPPAVSRDEPPRRETPSPREPGQREATRREPVRSEPAPWSGFGDDGPTPTTASWGATVDARHPDAPVNAPVDPIWVEQGARAGDVACPRCGAGNGPERQFCRHCGAQLAGGTAAALAPSTASSTTARTVPWWRKLTKSARRRAARVDPTSLAMDARAISTGGMSGRTMMFRAGGLALVLAGLLAFLGPWRGTVIASARTLLGGKQYTVIDADLIDAETVTFTGDATAQSLPQQIAENVIDRHANTSWGTVWLNAVETGAAPVPDDGSCVTEARTDSALQFTFAEPTDIARIEVLGGRYADDPARTLYSRPRIVELEIDGTCHHAELEDAGELVVVDISAGDVTQIDLRIVDVYADAESSTTVEISEVLFEKRR